MDRNSKNWLALNASALIWLVMILGLAVFAGLQLVSSLQPHAVQ